MAVRQNPDWYVWVKDVVYAAVRPPIVYFIIMGALALGLVWSNTPQQYRPFQPAVAARPQPQNNLQPQQPLQQARPQQQPQQTARTPEQSCISTGGYLENGVCYTRPGAVPPPNQSPTCTHLPGTHWSSNFNTCVPDIR